MANSPAEVASQALVLLGAEPINSITEESPRAVAANAIYADTRDEALREHRWNFATFRQALAQKATPPIFDYAYQFALPTDPYCLRVWETSLLLSDRWALEVAPDLTRVLVCDVSAVSIVFGGRVTSEALFDALFTAALAALLAMKLSYAIPGKASLQEAMFRLYKDRSASAKSVDGSEASPVATSTRALSEVR